MARRPMGAVALVVWALIAALAFGGFVALGQWQVQRRAWKLDLIEQVQTRIHAAPVAAPPRAQWRQVAASGQDYAYRRVTLSGEFLLAHTTLVQASTVLGAGWWVMTPLSTDDGTVLVNRGFVPQTQADGAWRARQQGRVTVTGLLRLPEPGGAWLRGNDPASGRWTSRDVAEIAAFQGLHDAAPYFLDLEAAAPLPPSLILAPPQRLPDEMLPVAGLTVVSFPNNHLIYALTWFGLALMVAGAVVVVGREELRLRRQAEGETGRQQHHENIFSLLIKNLYRQPVFFCGCVYRGFARVFPILGHVLVTPNRMCGSSLPHHPKRRLAGQSCDP